jgi:hypothetical protein
MRERLTAAGPWLSGLAVLVCVAVVAWRIRGARRPRRPNHFGL